MKCEGEVMMFKKIYHTGEIYDTNKCGKIIIIEDNGIFNNNNQRIVKIKYLDTGYECNAIYKNIIHNYNGKDPLRFMYEVSNKIFSSNNYGNYKIIDYDGKDLVKIHFIDTGYEYIVRKDSAINGTVKDPSRFMYNNKNKIFNSKYYGEVIIISEADYDINDIDHRHKKVNIKFLNTGSVVTVRYEDLIKGNIKDPTFKNAQEASKILGCQSMINIKDHLFDIWKCMMDRCTNINSLAYKSYGAKGVKISNAWYDFNNFFYDAQRLPGWEYKLKNPLYFQLDKDLLQIELPHNKLIYGRNTCIWLDNKNNLAITNGETVIKYNNIYCINNIYFVKSSLPVYFSYGPYFSLDDALQAPLY